MFIRDYTWRRIRKNERGQMILFVGAALVMLIGFLGLAIDAGRAYLVKAQLSKALDAAVLAAGQSGADSRDGDVIRNIIMRSFSANFPPDYMGVRGVPSPTYRIRVGNDLGAPVRVISASASATLPTFFMRVLGIDSMTVSSNAAAQRRLLTVVLVLDRSTSIGATDLEFLRNAAKNLVDKFDYRTDQVALATFAGTVLWGERLQRVGFDREAIKAQIDSITLDYWTASGPALGEAWQELSVNPLLNISGCPRPLSRRPRSRGGYEPSADRWRIIIFFTDGAPNVIRSDFSFTPCTDRFIGSTRDSRVTLINQCGANLAGSEIADPSAPGLPPRIDGLIRAVASIENSEDPYHEQGIDIDPRQNFGFSWESLIYPNRDTIGGCTDIRRRFNFASDPMDPVTPPPAGAIDLPLRDYYKVPFGPMPGVSSREIAVSPVTVDLARNVFNIPGPFGAVAGSRDDILRHAINGMARNEFENIANVARGDGIGDGFRGITIFTIGLDGAEGRLTTPYEEWGGETGEQILKRVANVPPDPSDPDRPGSDYNLAQPAGMYVYARNGPALEEAFSRVFRAIIRLSR
jgi:hypothetical protein